jgi:capsular polysaccharide biosynthesis protein
MDVNEVAARLIRRYWTVLLIAVAVPMVGIGIFVVRQPAVYTAHARIVAGAAIPRAQAEAVGVVSQVQAIATSLDVVSQALSEPRVDRRADSVAKRVVATGLGSSAVVDLAYSDRDPAIAQRVTSALAGVVVKQLDALRIGGLPDVLKDVDNQLTDLAEKRAPIAAAAQANPRDPVAQNRLAGIDRLISDLAADRNRLAEDAAAAGHASVVESPQLPRLPEPRGLPTRLSIAAVLGLAVGLVIVGINEMMRPSVSGAVRVGRLLDVPMLGAVGSDPAALSDIGRRLRLAARRAGVDTVVLVRANRAALPPELVDRIEAAALRPELARGRVAVPIETADTQLLTPSVSGSVSGNGAGPGPGEPSAGGTRASAAVLTRADADTAERSVRLRRVCAIDELDPSAEGDRIGLVVLAGASTRLAGIDGVRDLMTAAGWPLLGVLGGDGRRGVRR